MGKYNVLVVDDEKEITDAIEIYLKNEDINVIKAYDGLEALNIINNKEVHLVIMDLMMPKMDGMRATMNIREDKNIPIIILSAKSQDTDKILGLNIGADDYITKPFNPLELIARVKSQLRRYVDLGNYVKEESNDILTYGIVKLDKIRKYLEVDGKEIKITKTEYKILDLLLSNPGRVFSSAEIYERVWEEPCFSTDTVMVHIRRIREKIEIDPKKPRYLKVIWGVGYKFEK
ncbi:response regulator transcription factor [Clostridium tertium]|mgnify:FL=1|jgi:DNA-binding response OmpR family regulator|uniref:Stage 0 sporulation protein A homolog n=1 Tax=Clostridium tertium TaxID=1559 RepID=A0A9X4B3T7_9CLOT|nr:MULTISPECIES: response regulator transcription factor [Clostridium]MBS5307498.1 response regulator transcription factor [Clostridium sp.]MBS6502110.1 response regulator transcription factor [Clostridium sp.]MBU6137118.1 response regulator transcription factor [Clostridium tertium]MDB1924013.1 response regulator transcription factor [Clostridium tertium]MDB1927309.1 response regulator transcription factor [Clostridium tertium]